MSKINNKHNHKVIKVAFDSLGLRKPLIGIALVDGEKGNSEKIEKCISSNHRRVPAGCSFWEMAVKKLFYTVAEDHGNCSVGMFTHNFLQGEEDEKQLMKDISLMKKIDYVNMDEVASIPVLKKKYRYTVYGPWADFQKPEVKKLGIVPTVGFVFADAERGLILSEAVSRVDGSYAPAMGRPACAVIPQVVNTGKAAVSFGCCGARAYVLSLGKETDLWVFPGEKMSDYARAISTFTAANQILSAGHKKRRSSFSQGRSLELAEVMKS